MDKHRKNRSAWLIGLALGGCLVSSLALASGNDSVPATSDKLLLTGGVSQVEGAAGGGLTPWAVIGGYGTGDADRRERVRTPASIVPDYHLDDVGAMVGLYDRVELSLRAAALRHRAGRRGARAGTRLHVRSRTSSA